MVAGSALSAPPDEAVAPTAVVLAGDVETRVLLRGLLKLHHVRVVGEAGGAGNGSELVRQHRPNLLVVDTNLTDGSLGNLVPGVRSASPKTRIVVVQPTARAPPTEAPIVPDATLVRPFRIRDFVEAIGVATADPIRPPSAGSPAIG